MKKIIPKIKTIQVAIFSQIDLSDKLQLAQSIKSTLSKILDGEPLIIPLPADVPAEIPRIILKSANEKYNCNVGQGRLDFIFDEKDAPKLTAKDLKREFFPFVEILAKAMINQKKIQKINRLGLVTNFFAKLSKSATKFIERKFLREIPSGSPYEARLHLLYHGKIGNYEINKWIRLNPLRNVKKPSDDAALAFVIDINTLPEYTDKYSFTLNDIKDFYKEAIKIMEKDLKVYFRT